MDERTKELNRISDLLKNAFDGRYHNEPLSNHQKPVSVVPNRDFALKQFEFAKVAKMPISKTLVPKPTDLNFYWNESTIELIRKLVKEREQYKQNSELVNKQLVSESSDSAKDVEIVKLKQEIANLTQEVSNYKQIVKDDAIEKIKTQIENGKLSTELKECNDSVGKCNEDLGKCDEDLNECKEKNRGFATDFEEYANEVDKTKSEFEEQIKLLKKQLQEQNTKIIQLKTSNKLVEQENKFKFEKAQMDIMFGMKMDLIQKQFKDTIENISNLNANLNKQILDLTTANEDAKQGYEQSIEETKQGYEQSIEEKIHNFNEPIHKIEENNAKLMEENVKLIEANQSNKPIIAQSNPDKAKLEQLQTRVINLTQELLIVKMNADLQKQKNANYKYVPQTYEEAEESDMFDGLIEKGKLDLKGGAPKQRLSMKGGARRLYDDATQVVFKKETADKLREQMSEYQNRFILLKAEIDAFNSLSQSSVATTDSDAIIKLTSKLIALQTLYKDSQNNLTKERIANASNLNVQKTLKSSLTNATAIADLTKEKDDLKTEKAQLEKENADIKTAKDALENAKTTLETENATLKTENAGLESENAGLKTDKSTLAAENANLKGEKTNLTNAKATLEGEKTNLTNAKATLEVEKTNLTNENASLKTTNANLTNRLNATSTASGMSTAISTARSTLPRNPKVFVSDNGRVMFSEHK